MMTSFFQSPCSIPIGQQRKAETAERHLEPRGRRLPTLHKNCGEERLNLLRVGPHMPAVAKRY